MTESPERIWATEDADNFGEDKFHTTRPMAGLTEYIRADIHDAAVSAARKEGMLDAARIYAEGEGWDYFGAAYDAMTLAAEATP